MVQTNSAMTLNAIDPPEVNQTQFGPDMKRWLSTLVDTINSNFNSLSNLIAVSTIDVGGGGAGPLFVSVLGLTAMGFVNVTLISTTNPNITILNVTPTTNGFDITFSADPGASAIIAYQAFISQPQ